MSTVNIYILGSAATIQSAGQTPSGFVLGTAMDVLRKNDFVPSVYLIDPNFCYVVVDSIFQNQNLKNELAKLESYTDPVQTVGELFEKWDNPPPKGTHNIYVSYLGVKSCYDVMNIIEDFSQALFSFPPMDAECPLLEIVDDFMQGQLRTVPDLFDPNIVNIHSLHPDDLLAYKNYVLAGISLLRGYISAGFNDAQLEYPLVKISSWMYNLETPILKAIVNYYQLTAYYVSTSKPVTDLSLQNILLQSTQFRKIIIEKLTEVLPIMATHFGVLNLEITPTELEMAHHNIQSQV